MHVAPSSRSREVGQAPRTRGAAQNGKDPTRDDDTSDPTLVRTISTRLSEQAEKAEHVMTDS